MKYISVSFKNTPEMSISSKFTTPETKEVKVCEKNQEGPYSFNKKLRWGIIKTYTKTHIIPLQKLGFPCNDFHSLRI